MPATASRVSMPAGNRLSVSDSLNTHDVWQKSVGYDPYAGLGDEGASVGATLPDVGEINSSAKGLFRLAQLTGHSSTLAPGACKRCGQVGHLFFQCRNNFHISKTAQAQEVEEDDEDDPASDAVETSEDDDDSDSDSDDSDEDPDSDSSSASDSDSDSSSSSGKKKKKKGKKRKKSSKKEKKAKKKSKKKSKKSKEKPKKKKRRK
mmetsp:Transcript_118315/g.334335  ORF Transcript_118315/g.334335 Transcript_118315/m.334335 type:complete len:205 (-) Transcript_118315:81-695(-)